MIIFIDGFQNTGKSTLINRLPYEKIRFNFDKYLHNFNLLNKDCLKGFQLGKDLGILLSLQYFDNWYNRKNYHLIFDRGPFSTLYYSILENRLNEKEIDLFLKELSIYPNVYYVFFKKTNYQKIKRNKNDGFDYLEKYSEEEKEKALEILISKTKNFGISLIVFENDFSKTVEENIKTLWEILKLDEYDRN